MAFLSSDLLINLGILTGMQLLQLKQLLLLKLHLVNPLIKDLGVLTDRPRHQIVRLLHILRVTKWLKGLNAAFVASQSRRLLF